MLTNHKDLIPSDSWPIWSHVGMCCYLLWWLFGTKEWNASEKPQVFYTLKKKVKGFIGFLGSMFVCLLSIAQLISHMKFQILLITVVKFMFTKLSQNPSASTLPNSKKMVLWRHVITSQNFYLYNAKLAQQNSQAWEPLFPHHLLIWETDY